MNKHIFRERKISLCIIMIFMIVLTGMCCRMGQTDSLFCAVTGQNRIITSTENLIDASEVCTQELLKREGAGELLNNRVLRTRTNIGFILVLVIVGVILQYQKDIFTPVCENVCHQICSQVVILRYIHHQDGKKHSFIYAY